MGLFGLTKKKQEEVKPVEDSGITLRFNVDAKTTYKDVEGFFVFKNEVFYKPKNQGARHVITSETFMDFAKRTDATIVRSSQISNLLVNKLIPVNQF